MTIRPFLLLGALCSCGAPNVGEGVIEAPEKKWTWIDIPESQCANGTTTGLEVNLVPGAKDAVIYLAGGGACWDFTSCYVAELAWNVILGYGPTSFSIDLFQNVTLFDRRLEENPFKDASYVFLPYCTGDLHSGTRVASHEGITTHHVGAKNLTAFLKRLSPTFPEGTTIWVVGSSAGGFGAQMNIGKFAAAFPNQTVNILADSSAAIAPSGNRWTDWKTSWEPEFPADCTDCDGLGNWLTHSKKSLGNGRLGLISADADGLIANFAGLSPHEIKTQTMELVRTQYQSENSAAFVVPGYQHVFLLDDPRGLKAADGTKLSDWISGWYSGTKEFHSTLLP